LPLVIFGGIRVVGTFYAQSLPGRPIEEWEPLDVHLQAVAKLPSEFVSKTLVADLANSTKFTPYEGPRLSALEEVMNSIVARRAPEGFE
jgi:hypothetical protein